MTFKNLLIKALSVVFIFIVVQYLWLGEYITLTKALLSGSVFFAFYFIYLVWLHEVDVSVMLHTKYSIFSKNKKLKILIGAIVYFLVFGLLCIYVGGDSLKQALIKSGITTLFYMVFTSWKNRSKVIKQ